MDQLTAPAAFAVLGEAIAQQFNAEQLAGGDWTSEPRPAAQYGEVVLHHPGGADIRISHEGSHRAGRAGRLLSVEGRFPPAFTGRAPRPFHPYMDRSGAEIARSIARRWLPGYLELVQRGQRDQAASAGKARVRAEVNQRISRALEGTGAVGADPARTRSSWSGRAQLGLPEALAHGRAELSEDGTQMRLHLESVPVEVALRILALLEPRTVLEGRIMPEELEAPLLALPATPVIIPGTCTAAEPA